METVEEEQTREGKSRPEFMPTLSRPRGPAQQKDQNFTGPDPSGTTAPVPRPGPDAAKCSEKNSGLGLVGSGPKSSEKYKRDWSEAAHCPHHCEGRSKLHLRSLE